MPPSKLHLKSQGTKLEYTFKSDVLFKMLFVRYPDLLKRLVAVLLSIPLESIEISKLSIQKCHRKKSAKSFVGWT